MAAVTLPKMLALHDHLFSINGDVIHWKAGKLASLHDLAYCLVGGLGGISPLPDVILVDLEAPSTPPARFIRVARLMEVVHAKRVVSIVG
jgi:hypothetical protein